MYGIGGTWGAAADDTSIPYQVHSKQPSHRGCVSLAGLAKRMGSLSEGTKELKRRDEGLCQSVGPFCKPATHVSGSPFSLEMCEVGTH